MPTSFALKSHRVAFSLGLLKSHRVAISLELVKSHGVAISLGLLKSHRVAISLSSIALPKTAAGGEGVELRQKVQKPLSLLALKFWSNKIIDVDIILSITLTVR